MTPLKKAVKMVLYLQLNMNLCFRTLMKYIGIEVIVEDGMDVEVAGEEKIRVIIYSEVVSTKEM